MSRKTNILKLLACILMLCFTWGLYFELTYKNPFLLGSNLDDVQKQLAEPYHLYAPLMDIDKLSKETLEKSDIYTIYDSSDGVVLIFNGFKILKKQVRFNYCGINGLLIFEKLKTLYDGKNLNLDTKTELNGKSRRALT